MERAVATKRMCGVKACNVMGVAVKDPDEPTEDPDRTISQLARKIAN